MVQVLLPARLLQEAAACAVLGAALGAARAFLPVRGRAAFAPDVLLSGAVLLACQSYAAGYSAAGVLRWYMAAAAFAAALCAAGVLGVPLRALELQRVLSGDADQITEWVARDSYNYAAPNERIFVDVTGN